MPWISYIAIFFVVWFIVLFVTLPFGVRQVESPEAGHDTGAPHAPLMWWKAGASTIMALIFTTLIWAAFHYDWLDLHS